MALVASSAEAAAAEAMLRERYDFVALDEAELIVALGGDGFLPTPCTKCWAAAASARCSA